MTQGDPVKDTDGVNYTGWDQYEALASNISTNRLTVAGTQQSHCNCNDKKQRQLEWNYPQVPTFLLVLMHVDTFSTQGGQRIIASTSTEVPLGNSWQNMFNTTSQC